MIPVILISTTKMKTGFGTKKAKRNQELTPRK